MKLEHEEYFWLLKQFLEHKICPEEFQTAFFARFQNEPIGMDEHLFLILDQLFGALDCYTEDVELLAERPGFYLDINGLERECRDIFRRLEAWRASQMASSSKLVRAALDNPDLPVSFIAESLASMAEPRDDAIPFIPRSTKSDRSRG